MRTKPGNSNNKNKNQPQLVLFNTTPSLENNASAANTVAQRGGARVAASPRGLAHGSASSPALAGGSHGALGGA
jgi:hypothetical protein